MATQVVLFIGYKSTIQGVTTKSNLTLNIKE
uniref:Uncharacterized protein n=1 Tax=Arundo donax TaxID=35708 RepID=A0A0A9C663_ARUDO